MRVVVLALLVFLLPFYSAAPVLFAEEIQPAAAAANKKERYIQRLQIYQNLSDIFGVPWHYLAAIDQYERNILLSKKNRPKEEPVIGVTISPERWAGPQNPNTQDHNIYTILLHGGIGLDGTGDGIANASEPMDAFFAMLAFLLNYGTTEEQLKKGLTEFYGQDKPVELILNYARIYQSHNRLDLDTNVFPLPKGSRYSYRDTWGDARGWGGRRIHEGTDLFAYQGTPVRSTCFGYVEIKGWNSYGGWRVGIRDLNNVYHYYAHLAGFPKNLQAGQLVSPGDVVGWVGSSGYGKQGTTGKFPPHLHYGMYRFNGKTEWAFDPYPYLKRWERLKK